MTIVIIVGEFHKEIAGVMLASAKDEAAKFGVAVAREVWVPGSYEVPLIAQDLIARPEVDAVVALGFIEKGETMHGAVMGHTVEHALMDLSLQFKKPVGHGIIGPYATPEQAHVRTEDVARRAVQAVKKIYDLREKKS